MDRPPIQYAKSRDGVNIAFWSIGQGPLLVALHGGVSSHIGLEWDLPGAAEAYHRVAERHSLVRLDFRNSGLSTRGIREVGLEDHLADLEAVIARLPNEPVTLLGHGEKAQVAVKYAAENPERVSAIILTQAALRMESFMADERGRAFALIWPLAKED